MISLEEIRRVLGPAALGLTEDDLAKLRGLLYLLAERAVESEEHEAQRKAA